MKKSFLYVSAVLICLILCSCSRAPSNAAKSNPALGRDALATINGHSILLADFRAELERRARGRTDVFARREEREALLSELVEFESVYLRAKEAKFDEKPEIAQQIRRFIVDRFVEEKLSNTSNLPAVSEAEIANFYQQNATPYATKEQVRFAVIRLGFSSKATDDRKADVLRQAEAVLAEARRLDTSERTFGALAQRYSEDQATRYGGGDAGWHSRGNAGGWSSAVADAAFALKKVGDLSSVITTANGCYLVKLIDRKAAGRRPLAEVKEAIGYQLAVEKRQRAQQQFYETMKAGLKIEINRTLFESLAAPAIQTETKPPSVPAGG